MTHEPCAGKYRGGSPGVSIGQAEVTRTRGSAHRWVRGALPKCRRSGSGAGRADVRRLLALGAVYDVELDLLALGQRAVAVSDDRREVDEDVVSVRAFEEPVALLVAEPFDGSGGQAVPPPALRRNRRETARA